MNVRYEATTGLIQKYSPDQSRDDHGRFGSGGGMSSKKPTSGKFPVHVLDSDLNVKRFTGANEKEARKNAHAWYRQHGEGAKIIGFHSTASHARYQAAQMEADAGPGGGNHMVME